MKYLLDTNVLSIWIRGASPNILGKVGAVEQNDLLVSVISSSELLYGAIKVGYSPQRTAQLKEFLSRFAIIPIDSSVGEVAAEIRAKLNSEGSMIGPFDLLIAATALYHGLTLVTHNTSEFARVPGLSTEDWQ